MSGRPVPRRSTAASVVSSAVKLSDGEVIAKLRAASNVPSPRPSSTATLCSSREVPALKVDPATTRSTWPSPLTSVITAARLRVPVVV